MPFLLRVVLPDRPGSLGLVAAALGSAGADIEAIEVVERRPDGSAVDDVVVELPGPAMPEDLVSACARVPGVHVEWISRYSAGGSLFLDLEAVEEMTRQPGDALAVLVDLLPGAFRSDWAALVTADGTTLATDFSSHTAPDLDGLEVPALRVGQASRIEPPESWGDHRGADLILAGARILDSDHLLLLGRGGGPDILDSELARLGHLASLATSIAAATGGTSPTTGAPTTEAPSAGAPSAEILKAGPPDGGPADGGPADGGLPDGRSPDGGGPGGPADAPAQPTDGPVGNSR